MKNLIATLPNQFKLFEYVNYQNDHVLVNEISELLAPSYINTDTLLERELAHNKIIYFTRDTQNKLSSFFMTNYDEVNGKTVCYMGLLAVADNHKGKDLAGPILYWHIQKTKSLEKKLGYSIWCWATTATTSVYQITKNFSKNVEPQFNGTYSNDGLDKCMQIKNHYNLNISSSHPFVIKEIAKGTQYSAKEKEHIYEYTQKRKFELFNQLQVNESKGDRLILIIDLPDLELINFWGYKKGLPILNT